MSLTRLALRIATVQALLGGRTMVSDDRIFDSALAPIDDMANGATDPFIVVYTDDGERKPEGRDILTAMGSFSLVIEYAYVSPVGVTEDGDTIWGAPDTDEGKERILDQIERQITVALANPRPPGAVGHNSWAALWRDLIITIRSIRMQRGGSAKEGVRFAARQLTIEVETVAEPPYGAAVEGVWQSFFAALRAAVGTPLPELAARLEVLVIGEMLPGWQVAAEIIGTDHGSIRSIGLAPADATETGEAAPLSSIAVEGLKPVPVVINEP